MHFFVRDRHDYNMIYLKDDIFYNDRARVANAGLSALLFVRRGMWEILLK